MALATANVVPRLKTRYEEEIRPQLVERFGYSSVMEAPRLVKITLNMGVGDAKQDSKMLDAALEQLGTIAGQQPNVRRARRSIAGFKLREEMPVGVAVTLRDARMYEFLDRLTSVAIPRVRDFRGLNPRAFDGRGNYSMGVREQIIFPEIDYDAIDQVRGLDITITTTARTDAEAFALLDLFGMPFRREEAAAAAAEAGARRADEARGGPSQAAAIPAGEELPEQPIEAPGAPAVAPTDPDVPEGREAEVAPVTDPADAGSDADTSAPAAEAAAGDDPAAAADESGDAAADDDATPAGDAPDVAAPDENES